MITPVTYYTAVCDNCKETWSNDHHGWAAMNDEAGLKDILQNDDWCLAPNGKTYCPKCYSFDDDDSFSLNQNRTK